MTRRIWIVALVAATLVFGSVAAASALPGGSADPSRHAASSTVISRPAAGRPATPAASITNPGRSTTSTTTLSTAPTVAPPSTTTTRPHLLPGRMAAPRPPAPVALTETTPVLNRVPTTDKVIFLGIDDGLVRDPALIALVREQRIPLTLFLTRAPAEEGRDFFRAMQEAGATVQAHTESHPRLTTLGWSDQQDEICGGLDALTAWFGHRPTLFRPPYGEWNATTQAVARGCGLRGVILWRGATNDGRLDIVGGKFHPGDILLMHFRRDLVENLRLVLARADEQGYRIGRLEDYLGTGPEHPMFADR